VAHQWFLRVTPRAQEHVDQLPTSKIRLAVFGCLREMLNADNPLALIDVEKVQSMPGVWKRRQGDYRLFFSIDSQPVTDQRFSYKGTLILLMVRKRDESTYR
jgi:mRNA-degrading endonuclease RelE of RelBE toxin-antitoxin system